MHSGLMFTLGSDVFVPSRLMWEDTSFKIDLIIQADYIQGGKRQQLLGIEPRSLAVAASALTTELRPPSQPQASCMSECMYV